MDLNRFQPYLIEKLKILKEYFSVSESMKKSLDLLAMDEVVQGMMKRQEIIGRINRIDEDIRTIASKSLEEGKEPEGSGEEVSLLSRAISEVLHSVKILDGECQQRITVLQNEIKAELQKTYQEMRTVRGYMGKPAGPPNFLDVRR